MLANESFKARGRLLAAALLAGTALGLPVFARAQTFVPAGPGVEIGPSPLMNGADLPTPGQSTDVAPMNATQSGAIQALAFDPSNYGILLAGSPNGGVFRSTDGGLSWKATTDNQASLSIASLSFDTSDTTGNTVIAGISDVSAGATFAFRPYFDRSRGGALTGLLLSGDAGATWTGVTANLPQVGIQSAAVRGGTILAAAFNEVGSWQTGDGVEAGSGLYRSTDSGKSFTLVTAGLPAGAATALVGDPANPNRFYVGVTTAGAGNANNAGTSVYTTVDGGLTWTKVFDATQANGTINAADPTALRLAAGPNGSVALAVIDGATGTVTGVFLSKNNGATWNDLSVALTPGSPNGTQVENSGGAGNRVDTPGRAFTHVVADAGDIPNLSVNPGGQAAFHSVISIDPNNPNVIYLAGDRQDLPSPTGATTYSGNALRAVLNDDGTVTYAAITDDFTADHSTYHPDSRAMAFDAAGNLVVGSDGGVYTRSSPQTSAGVWRGLNMGRQALEVYDLSLDPHSGLIAVAAQDNGTAIQSPTTRSVYRQVAGGDGSIAVTNGVTDPNSSWTYVACQYLCGGPTRIQTDLKGNFTSADHVDIYYSIDGTPDGIISIDSSDVIFTPKLKLNNIDPSFQALGVQPGIILAQDNVMLAPTKYADTPLFGYNGQGSYTILPLNYAGPTGFNSALDFGTRDNEFALLAGGSSYQGHRLFVSNAIGYNNVFLQPVLSYTGFAPTAVLFDPRSQNRFFATDTNLLYGTVDGGTTGTDLTGNLPAHFTRPQSLAFISNNGVNALLVGGLNDAANVGSPLVVADSSDAGDLSAWRRFGLGLPNALIDVLDYVPSLDALAVGTYGRGAFLLYDVTSNFSTASVLQFGLANNDSAPDASILTGDRPLIKYGSGTLTISGAATYTGGSDIQAGQFVLDGSVLNDTLVEAGATMSGVGSVGGKLTVNGTLVPGYNVGSTSLPISTLLNAGTLTAGSFAAGPGSVLQIYYGSARTSAGTYLGPSANSLAVTGAADITGMTAKLTSIGGPAVFDQRYTFLTSGSLTGQFTNGGTFVADSTDPALLDRLRYDLVPNGVVLEAVRPTDFGQAAANTNQAAVAAVLNANALTGSDAFLNGLNGLYNGGVPASSSLAALTGEGAINIIQGARVAGDQFMHAVGGHVAGLGETDSATIQTARNGVTAFTTASAAVSDLADRGAAMAAYGGPLQSSAAWGDAFYASDRLTGSTSTVKSRATGFAAGFERRLGDYTKVGAAIGYARVDADTDSLATKASGDYFNGSLYASHKAGPWFVGGVLSYSSGDNSERRTVALVGGPTYGGRGSVQDTDFQASVLGGRAFRIAPDTRLTAHASFTVSDLDQHGFTETGADVFSLQYGGVRLVNYMTEAGVKLDHTYRLHDGGLFDPYIGVAGVLLNGDRTATSQLDFIGAPTSPFRVVGARLPGGWADVKIGAKYSPNARLKFDVRYQGAYGDRLNEDSVLAHASLAF